MEDIERAEQLVGTVLKKKWKIEKILGVGGTATVFLATHRNQRKVAVKLLHQRLSGYPEVRDRFLREGYVANTLETDGVVEILDDDVTEDGQAFLVMEVLEGETVDARWMSLGQKMPAPEAMKWLDPTLVVLHHAHQKGIVHRDIKPENLFITTEDRLKVLDFGIARIFEDADMKGTKQGHVMGTPAFMAPEQARGKWKDVDGRTDIWAVGATLFTLLTGRYVHEAEGAAEQVIKAATEPAPSLLSIDPWQPPKVAELVDRALAFNRESRFQDAEEFRQAMLLCMAKVGERAPSIRAPAVSFGPARHSVPPIEDLPSSKFSLKDVRPSGLLEIDLSNPTERLAISETKRDKLLSELKQLEGAQEGLLGVLADLREKRRAVDLVRKTEKIEPPKVSAQPVAEEVQRGRDELRIDPAHASWPQIEELGLLWEAAERDARAFQKTGTRYSHFKFHLGWLVIALCLVALGYLFTVLAAKPEAAPDTLELQRRHQ